MAGRERCVTLPLQAGVASVDAVGIQHDSAGQRLRTCDGTPRELAKYDVGVNLRMPPLKVSPLLVRAGLYVRK